MRLTTVPAQPLRPFSRASPIHAQERTQDRSTPAGEPTRPDTSKRTLLIHYEVPGGGRGSCCPEGSARRHVAPSLPRCRESPGDPWTCTAPGRTRAAAQGIMATGATMAVILEHSGTEVMCSAYSRAVGVAFRLRSSSGRGDRLPRFRGLLARWLPFEMLPMGRGDGRDGETMTDTRVQSTA